MATLLERCGSRRITRASAFLLGLASLGVGASAHGLAGVCPDGSVFIVRSAAQIPCRGAKAVEPSKVPPMRPENLPRPYLWEVYRERADVGRNPYHLLDRADEVRNGTVASPTPAGVASPSSPSAAPSSQPVNRVRDLGLSEGEVRDLFVLVELSQQRSPVHFVEADRGRERLRVSFAHSRAFAERAQSGGLTGVNAPRQVLLFSAVAAETTAFHPNFTLVQGHLAFQPDVTDTRQLGFLRGGVGPQAPDAVALGYVVLPEGFDLSRPLDLYWNDRRIEAAQLML